MSERRLHPFSTPTTLAHSRLDARSHSRRSLTPNGRVPTNSTRVLTSIEGDLGAEDDPRLAVFKDLYSKSEARLALLFEEQNKGREVAGLGEGLGGDEHEQPTERATTAQASLSQKRKARAIDEEDYDDDDSEGEDAGESTNASPLKAKGNLPPANLALSSIAMSRGLSQASTPGSNKGVPPAGKTTEAVRRKLEEDKKATEDAAKRTFHTLFYTLENDKDAMLEQKKLEESERKVDAELGTSGTSSNGAATSNGQQGILSQTNLGASSLTLKNLIRRIDDQRDKVKASDSELRSLMSEVRKNRSKWASEDKVGQEELYESFDKVLSELKGQTEHSTHFLNKVNKKEAPDYGNIIKHPMDLGTMTKKLKNFQYKSKRDFVDDCMLIWANCLKYNANPDHYMRKHALFMRKETEKLVPLIPDIVIRDRAEIEAEERRLQHGGIDLDGDEDSDDEPIISSRGRKAPSKKSKKGTTARKAPAGANEDDDTGAIASSSLPNGVHPPKDDNSRADSENVAEGSQTPPRGTATPTGVNGILAHGAAGTQGDAMDIDGDSMVNGIIPSAIGVNEEPEIDDLEYKTWKQVTKKDRAIVTAERHRLFKGDHLDPDAPALLRTKAGMRSWLRKQKQAVIDSPMTKPTADSDLAEKETGASGGETLAEGMEGEDERVLPDYYDPLAAIPDISPQLRWVEDPEGNLQDTSDEFLREVPQGLFISPESTLTRKIDDNVRQIQKTRKLTSKIGVVKQMALQSQLYQGQFQKTEIVPLVEHGIEPHVASDDGPMIAPEVCRAALQRSTAKLLVHAGFDEFQPSALDAFTDLAGDYFTKLARTLNQYSQAPQVPVPVPGQPNKITWKQRLTSEECILHTLQENGADLEGLDSYVTEDVERTGTRLATSHDRMKAHLADLLRPALHDAGPDGSGAFNDDSEQFVSGDFAEELGDDFFGFKELGLDLEFGDSSMSVPLHLLQKSMFNANQAQNQRLVAIFLAWIIPYQEVKLTPHAHSSGASTLPSALAAPSPFTPITVENVKDQIGLVQNFFLAKLHANNDNPLIEDEDLPLKQRFPKPRLPPTGKITSPRKRPVKEPGPGKGHPRKKLKLNDGTGEGKPPEGEVGGEGLGDPVKKVRDGTMVNGEMSREPSQTDGRTTTSALSKPLTNGVLPTTTITTTTTPIAENNVNVSPTRKGKGKELNGIAESGSLPSPESLGPS
ncbi:MAG: hypothetical protein Q9217_001026 [Psora testacea]